MPHPTARERLGQHLKQYRTAAKISGHSMAAALGLTQASISRIESGKQPIAPEMAQLWLDTAQAPAGSITDIVALADQAELEVTHWRDLKARGWDAHQQSYQDLEGSASTIKIYQPSLIPGLLQSFGYARHLMRHVVHAEENHVETAVNARLRRQEILYLSSTRLDVIVCEHVLRQPLGGHAVMAEQLHYLASKARLPTVDLRVIPTATTMNATWGHSYVLLEMPADAESVVIVEVKNREVRDGGHSTIETYRQAHDAYRSAALSGDLAIEFVETIAAEHTKQAFA